MRRLRDALLFVLLIYPLLIWGAVIVIRDNNGGRQTFTVEAVNIQPGVVTGMPDRIWSSGFERGKKAVARNRIR